MAKCAKCGRRGLFLRVNEDGLCDQCARIALYEHREDRQTPITAAVHRQRQSMDAEADEIASAEKKLRTIENRIARLKHVFDSMQYAVEKYMQPDAHPFAVRKAFDIADLDLIASPALKCMEMKDLRAQYRQNERAIKEVQAEYEGRYTTKANVTIYKLMVLALDAELQNILGIISESVSPTARWLLPAPPEFRPFFMCWWVLTHAVLYCTMRSKKTVKKERPCFHKVARLVLIVKMEFQRFNVNSGFFSLSNDFGL